MANMEMFERLLSKMDQVEKNIDLKLATLASKDDLAIYKVELQKVQENTEEVKNLVLNVQKDRESDKRRLEMLEREYRNKNLVFKGIPNNNNMNLRNTLEELITVKMDITPVVKIQQVYVLKRAAQNMVVMVRFYTEDDVRRVLEKTRLLTGTAIYIDRDMTEQERSIKQVLMRIRRIILSKLSDADDKTVKVRVQTNCIRIKEYMFKWNGDNLMCGKESGNNILSQIYLYKFNFDTVNFKNLISDNNI